MQTLYRPVACCPLDDLSATFALNMALAQEAHELWFVFLRTYASFSTHFFSHHKTGVITGVITGA